MSGYILPPCLFKLYAEAIIPGWNHKLELRFKGEISITLDIQMTPPLGQKAKKNEIDGETMETVTDFIFLGSKITADGDCSH